MHPAGTGSILSTYPFLAEFTGIEQRLGIDVSQDCGILRDQPELTRAIVNCALEVPDRTLSELMPTLPRLDGSRLPMGVLHVRSQHVLSRDGVSCWSDLVKLTPVDLWRLRNSGHKTVVDIVRMCVRYAGKSDLLGLPNIDSTFMPSDEPQGESDFDRPYLAFVEASAQLRSIAAWALRERSVDEAKAVWQLRPELNAPQFVRAAWEGFLATRLDDLADPELLHEDAGALVEALLSNFEAGRRQVLLTRVLSTQPQTLQEIGRSLGVTRARVGQIDALVEAQLESLLGDRRFLPLHWRAGDLAQTLGGAAPSHSPEITRALSRAVRHCPDELTTTLAALLLRLGGPYTAKNGWYIRRGSKVPNARELEKLADDHGLVSLPSATEWLMSQEVDPKHLDDCLSGRFKRFGDALAVWSGSVADKCVSILAIKGTPTDAETLVAQIGEGHSVRGVRARLFEDPRLMRTSRNQWGLRAWQLEEYTGITEEIAQRIEERGGRAKITDLADELVQLFGVSAASVRVYAGAPMFVTEDGYVRLRQSGEEFSVESDLSRCRGTFKLSESSWSYLITIDRDVLRGSGRGFPGGLAAALDVGPGKSRLFSTNGGQLKASWPQTSGLGPSLGSTRELAADAGAVEGDLLRLEFDADRGKCAGFRIPSVALSELSDDDAIKALTGLRDTSEDLATVVARSIGTDAVHLAEVLRQRGDTKLAELLPVRASSPRRRRRRSSWSVARSRGRADGAGAGGSAGAPADPRLPRPAGGVRLRRAASGPARSRGSDGDAQPRSRADPGHCQRRRGCSADLARSVRSQPAVGTVGGTGGSATRPSRRVAHPRPIRARTTCTSLAAHQHRRVCLRRAQRRGVRDLCRYAHPRTALRRLQRGLPRGEPSRRGHSSGKPGPDLRAASPGSKQPDRRRDLSRSRVPRRPDGTWRAAGGRLTCQHVAGHADGAGADRPLRAPRHGGVHSARHDPRAGVGPHADGLHPGSSHRDGLPCALIRAGSCGRACSATPSTSWRRPESPRVWAMSTGCSPHGCSTRPRWALPVP